MYQILLTGAKNRTGCRGDRFYFSDASYEEFGDGASVPYIDLCLMTLCGGAIIANSSLSWWGAWLQKSGDKMGKNSVQKLGQLLLPTLGLDLLMLIMI